MVKHARGALICDFEIMSRQTADAKGEMNTEEYLEHCRAVVRYRGKTTSRLRKACAEAQRTSTHEPRF